MLHRISLTVLAALALSCAATPPAITGRVVEEDFVSATVGDTYQLVVRLPPGYDDSSDVYPVLVQLDALQSGGQFNITAGHASELASEGAIPEIIVVGVGGGDRFRDFTVDGVEAFLRFLREELLPHVDATYRTDAAAGRALFGHSLGGFFSLYTLLSTGAEASPPFTAFVAADPSLTEGDVRLLSLEDELSASTTELPRRLYFPIARYNGAVQRLYFDELSDRLDANYTGLDLRAEVLETDHGGAVDPSYADGLRFVFGGVP